MESTWSCPFVWNRVRHRSPGAQTVRPDRLGPVGVSVGQPLTGDIEPVAAVSQGAELRGAAEEQVLAAVGAKEHVPGPGQDGDGLGAAAGLDLEGAALDMPEVDRLQPQVDRE